MAVAVGLAHWIAVVHNQVMQLLIPSHRLCRTAFLNNSPWQCVIAFLVIGSDHDLSDSSSGAVSCRPLELSALQEGYFLPFNFSSRVYVQLYPLPVIKVRQR